MQTTNTSNKTPATKSNETLTTYVGDVHAMVTHGLRVIMQQTENLKKVSHKDAMPAINEARRVLESEKTALEARLKSLGGSTTAPVKDAVSAIAGAAAGIVNAIRPSETVKSLRDDATFFSGLGISYLLLYTTACGLGDTETANVAQMGYEHTARLVMHFDSILPKITIEELREDNPAVSEVSEKVRTMVKGVWNREKSSGIGQN